MFTDQSAFDVRFEWGERGLEAVGRGAATLVIVDVLSFCTCVDIATSRGAAVFPWNWRDETAQRHAHERGAILASKSRSLKAYSLSPSSLAGIEPGAQILLPSPNGAALSLRAESMGCTIAGCLRNAGAVADLARSRGGKVAVIGAGERWPDGSLRPSWEDLVGAGAVIVSLEGARSPEAKAASAAFNEAKATLPERLLECSSGRELAERGFRADVELSALLGASTCIPWLDRGRYVAWNEA